MAETQAHNRNQVNTSEGTLSFGYVMENNAKMAAILGSIIQTNFVRDHYIGLQQTGKLRGSIYNSAPAVFQIDCGEKPVNGQAGVWVAHNGDIDIRAPRGKITLQANNIEILSSGDGTKTGHILLSAGGKIQGLADDIKWEARDNATISGDGTLSQITTGQVQTVGGSVVSRESDGLGVGVPGGGSETFLEWTDGMKRLIKSIA